MRETREQLEIMAGWSLRHLLILMMVMMVDDGGDGDDYDNNGWGGPSLRHLLVLMMMTEIMIIIMAVQSLHSSSEIFNAGEYFTITL